MSTEKKLWVITIVFAALFGYGVYNVFKPDRPPLSFVRGTVREISPGVLIGPYPTDAETARLKAMGVRTVISLMDPDSAAESMVEAEGRKIAVSNGLEYHDFPVNVTDMEGAAGSTSFKEAVRLAMNSNGKKVYIHCYLGRHRVSIFEREFLKAEKDSAAVRPLKVPEGAYGR